MMQKNELLSRIQSNISEHGYHVTVVSGDALPRFAYTIGCKNSLGAEFIFAGGEYYSQVHIGEIIAEIISLAKRESDWFSLSICIRSLGTFSISKADVSWSKLLLLGAFDYYHQPEIEVWQILPDGQHRTLDVPDMSQAFDISSEPIWQWLSRKWDYPIPNTSMAVSNLQVLFGAKATEVTRWEKDEWEIFAGAGPDVPKEDMRMVPMGILLGIDKSLEPAAHLAIGKGIWRDDIELEWNDWE